MLLFLLIERPVFYSKIRFKKNLTTEIRKILIMEKGIKNFRITEILIMEKGINNFRITKRTTALDFRQFYTTVLVESVFDSFSCRKTMRIPNSAAVQKRCT